LQSKKHLRILGIRGVPASHGGFETFAEQLATYLVGQGWRVTVYCQVNGGQRMSQDQWHEIDRIHIPVRYSGPLGTVVFDWKSIWHAAHSKALVLTLGYNTAAFCAILRLRGIRNVINMDGIEWRREKWSWAEKAWLYANERLGCWLANHLVADHPGIRAHLLGKAAADKITTIPYGALQIDAAPLTHIVEMGLESRAYCLVIARPEPENSILEIVRAFSRRRRGCRLLVLGEFQPKRHPYHSKVMDVASDEVVFPGAIYNRATVSALRFHALLYIHGHTVGGTNPSLVEALGAGSPVVAHDNPFNRWVLGNAGLFFAGEAALARILDDLIEQAATLASMSQRSRRQFSANFTWPTVLARYEELLLGWIGSDRGRR